MTDLNDFFAKKDRKKKRAAARSNKTDTTTAAPKTTKPSTTATATATASTTATATVTATPPNVTSTPASASSAVPADSAPTAPATADDEWIEIDDNRGSQVNTGGRTVVELKHDHEEKEKEGDNSAQVERFSGWGKSAKTESEDGADAEKEAEEEAAKPAAPQPYRVNRGPNLMAPSSFPSLADAAKIQTVTPQTQDKPTSHQPPSANGRPRQRFFVDKEKLKRKVAERENNKVPPQ